MLNGLGLVLIIVARVAYAQTLDDSMPVALFVLGGILNALGVLFCACRCAHGGLSC